MSNEPLGRAGADKKRAMELMFADPHPMLHRLRARGGIVWHRPTRQWSVTSYALSDAILRDRRFQMIQPSPESAVRDDAVASGMRRLATDMLLETEGARHARIKSALMPLFGMQALVGLRKRAEEITAELLDRVSGRTELDLVRDLAYPLPVALIGEIIGIPPADREEFSELCRVLSHGGGRPDGTPSGDELAAADAALTVIREQLLALAELRRVDPRDDLISHLVAPGTTAPLDDDEMVANLFALYLAGHETTKNLVGSGMLALLSDRELMRSVWRDPDVVEDAVEEMLRYDTPLSFTMREARADVEIGGVRILRGQRLQIMLCAANRDPVKYTGPDAFDLDRPTRQVLSFGAGQHFCLGAHLARMEGSVVLHALINAYEDIRLRPDAPFTRTPYFVHRGLESLPVVVTPRSVRADHV